MKFLLDTDICIYLINHRPPEVQDRFRQHRLEDIALSTISVFELTNGALKSRNMKQNEKALSAFTRSLLVLDFNQAAAIRAAQVRATLEMKGTPIGGYDLLIAGTALSENLTLVTNNTREFSRIEGLKLENWTR